VRHGWWRARIKRTWAYVWAGISAPERNALKSWLRPQELALFDQMNRADRRHGLDVVRSLRRAGAIDRDLLAAGLIHDCGKGPRVHLIHRIVWALGQRYGDWIWSATRHLPTFRFALAQLRHHAEISARMADEAGCSRRTVDLIRLQENPIDEDGEMLRAADEAN
jgi:hypothetical protein